MGKRVSMGERSPSPVFVLSTVTCRKQIDLGVSGFAVGGQSVVDCRIDGMGC
jgi:hypothetical protein